MNYVILDECDFSRLPVSPAVSSAVGHSFYSTDVTASAHNGRHLGRQFSSLSLTR